MQVCELEHRELIGKWIVDWSNTGECDYSDPGAVVELHHPVLELKLYLAEITYKDLMDDPRMNTTFLHQNLRIGTSRYNNAYRLPRGQKVYYFGGISYQGFSGDTMIFYVTPSTEYSHREKYASPYMCQIKFLSWDEIGNNPDMTIREKVSYLLWDSDIQLHCTDPSFLYYGFEYILSQINAAIIPQGIPPTRKNPTQQGLVCKHLNRILRVIPFYFNDIGLAITRQWGGQVNRDAIDQIAQRAAAQQEVNQGVNLPPEAEQPPPEAELPPQDQQQQEQPPPENPDETPASL
jgi:hypothetical protein